MEFFTSPEDLKGWVKSQESSDSAAQKRMEIIMIEIQTFNEFRNKIRAIT